MQIIHENIGVYHEFPPHLLSWFTHPYFLSYLHYGILIWANKMSIRYIVRGPTLQKKALRIIYYIFIIFLENKLLKVKALCLFQLGRFTNSYNNNTLPHVFLCNVP